MISKKHLEEIKYHKEIWTDLYRSGLTFVEIANKYEVSTTTVHRVIYNKLMCLPGSPQLANQHHTRERLLCSDCGDEVTNYGLSFAEYQKRLTNGCRCQKCSGIARRTKYNEDDERVY